MLAVREQAAPDCRSREEPGGWITEAAPRGRSYKSGVLLRQSGRAAERQMPGCRVAAAYGPHFWDPRVVSPTPEKHAQGEFSRVEDGDSDGNRFRYRLRGSRQLHTAASHCGMGSSAILTSSLMQSRPSPFDLKHGLMWACIVHSIRICSRT
jgi:hypothetical protein